MTVVSVIRRFTSNFFFNDTATTEIYTLSLHDALPISRDSNLAEARLCSVLESVARESSRRGGVSVAVPSLDRKSTRLNSSHLVISYAVFCLKKKNKRFYLQMKK